jgi:hypothetical protein
MPSGAMTPEWATLSEPTKITEPLVTARPRNVTVPLAVVDRPHPVIKVINNSVQPPTDCAENCDLMFSLLSSLLNQ